MLSITTAHEVQAVPLAVNDNADTAYRSLSTIELMHSMGHASAIAQSKRQQRLPQSRRSPQNRDEGRALSSDYEDALGTITRIEAEAGPALGRRLLKAKRCQAVYGLDREREGMKARRLGQRSGLLKLMQVEFHTDYPHDVTDRSRLYIRHMLMISANVAAITGSGWSSTLGWFERHLPILTARLTPDALHEDFERYVVEARAELASRIPSGSDALRTGPSPAEIAEELSITTEQLRFAGANRCGLTSIDPEDRKTRDQNRKEVERRAKGMKAQTERTKIADMKALAERLGCSLSTIRRRDGDGTLAAFVAEREGAEQNVSVVLKEINEGQILFTSHDRLTSIATVNDDLPAPPRPLSETGFTGQHVTLSSQGVQHVLQRHPKFASDLRGHLKALDAHMSKAAPGCEKRVMRNFLKDRHRAVSLAMTKAANCNLSAVAA